MKIFRIIFLILTVLIFFACNKGEEPSSASADTEEVSKEEIEEVIILEPVQNEGLISFITGDVFLIRDNTESLAEIGDTVAVNDIIRTGEDGLCEIQIGTTAIISLMENTDFSLSTVSLKSKGNIVKVKVIAGMAAFKINKLLDKDRFTIDTPTMTCGIRGTRFLIKVIDHQTTEIAVIEGNVAVIPVEAETLFDLKETAPEELAVILEELLNIETIIEAGKEIIIKAADFAPMAEQLQKIVEEVLSYEEKTDEEKTSIISQVETVSIYLEKAVKTIPETVAIASLNEKILKPLETREFLTIQSLEEQKIEKKPLEYRALIINVEPGDAKIYMDGQLRGYGQISALFPLNTELELLLQVSGYEDVVDLLTIGKVTPKTYNYTMERKKREILLKVDPADADVIIGGVYKGKGKTTVSFPYGAELDVLVERKGYKSYSSTIYLTDVNPESLEISLEPLPLYGLYQLDSGSLTGQIVVSGNMVIAVDEEGVLLGINIEGEGKWNYNTSNLNNEAAYPVSAGKAVLFAGTKQFVAVSPISGSVIYQKELGSLNSLPFGNKPLYTNRAIVYPEQPGLRFLDPESFSDLGFLPLPELLMTTPAVKGEVIYVVDFVGTLYAVSLSDHSILWSSQTPLRQPAGVSLTLYKEQGFIGDTKGTVVAVNLDNGEVLWSAKMPKRVTSNIVVYEDIAYVWSDGVIHTLSIIDGSESDSSFPGAVTPPLVVDGRIYYGNNENKLLVYNIKTLELIYDYQLNGSITTRPVKIDNFIVLGLENGAIAIVNEEAFGL